MTLSSGQRPIVIILLLAFLSGGGVLGYKISREYPKFAPTPEIEKPPIEEAVPSRPVVVTEKTPIRKLAKEEREKLKAALAININTASSKELQKLSYVGPATAKKIIAGRPYRRKEDIMRVSGISEGRYQQIKDHISVSGKGMEEYKPSTEKAKPLAPQRKIKIVKVDTDGDGIPDTWITNPQ